MRPPAASTNRRARVAMPDSRCRKLSAVRSPTSSARRRPDDLGDRLAGTAALAVALRATATCTAGLELAERLERDVEAGEHAVGLDEEDAAGPHDRRHGRVGRDVAAADVFLERAPDDVAVERRIERAQHVGCG